MSDPMLRYNDRTSSVPRLRVQHSLWSLGRLPMNAATEWTLDEKFRRVREAGFETVECWLTDQNEQEVTSALRRHGLGLVMGHRPFILEDVQATVERAVRCGADFLFAQPASAFTPLEEVVRLVRAGRQLANDHGLAFFVETHRNNFTENLPQTLRLLDAVPDLRLTADLSHFVVVGEFYGWKEEGALERLTPVLARTAHLHGRISNGEAVQVDVGDGNGQTAQFFVELWTAAMRYWLADARPGDVFPFASELGPPRYAITLPDGSEFSDRWEQSLVIKRLAEQAWRQACSRIEGAETTR
jgi:sugar phosphate isomerase/epimerase